MNIRKKITALGLVMAMTVSMASLSTSAITYKGETIRQTSGGTAGKVKIRSRIYTDVYQPSGGVRVYNYGAISDVKDSSTIKTKFNITGIVSNSTSSTTISAAKTANSVKAYTSSSYSDAYKYCSSKTKTSSSSFGSSSQECNFSF